MKLNGILFSVMFFSPFLYSQTYLKRFYSSLRFQETGEEYLEDGIPHVMMVRG